jgi:hypothetical protein
MKRIIFRALPILLLLILTIGIIVSCEYTAGIFYTIENSREIEDLGLPNEVTVGGVAEVGSYMYAAVGSLYRKEGKGDWLPVTPAVSDCITMSIAPVGSDLYAVFTATDGNTSTLYKYALDTWTKVTADAIDTKKIIAVFSTNSNLFALEQVDLNKYTLWDGSNGTAFTAIAGMTDITRMVTDVEYDDQGTFGYYAVAGEKLYSGATAGALTEHVTTAPENGTADLKGLYFDSTSPIPTLYLSDTAGFVYLNTDDTASAAWIKSADALQNNSDNAAALRDFLKVNLGSQELIILGSEDGYYEQSTGTTFTAPTDLTKSDNYINLKLRAADITLVFQRSSETDFDFYIGTAGKRGHSRLWRRLPSLPETTGLVFYP